MSEDLSIKDFEVGSNGYSINGRDIYCRKISNYNDFENKEHNHYNKNRDKLPWISFSNMTFHNEMVFEFTEKSISFSNCTFVKEVNFVGSNNLVSFFNPLNNVKIDEKGTHLFVGLSGSNVDTISLGKDIKLDKIIIHFTALESIRIYDSFFNHLTISGTYGSKVRLVRIDTINSPCLTLKNFALNRISFGDTSSINSISIENISLIDNTKLYFWISNVRKVQVSRLDAEELHFDFLKVGTIELFDIDVKSTSLKIQHYIEPDDIGIRPERPLTITTLRICGNISFNFNNMIISNLELKGDFFHVNKIQNSSIGNLSFNDFSISENLEFKKIKIVNQPKLVIRESLLENVVLKPSFLHLFSKIEYSQSSMEGIKLVDYKEVRNSQISNRNTEKIKLDKIDLLRFFKNYASQNGNKYLYHKYKAAEYNSLAWRRHNKLNFLNRFILICNTISNNHTTNPVLAFCWIIILVIGFIGFLVHHTNSEYVIYLFSNFPEYFLTPIRFFSSLTGELQSLKEIQFLNLVDFLYKILLSYLIYQFVASFRKFSS